MFGCFAARVAQPQAPHEKNLAKLEAAHRKVKEILELGRIPDCLFRCGVGNGTLTLTGGPSQTSGALLLFSTVFAAADYLRATGAKGTPIQLKAENLPRFAQSCVVQRGSPGYTGPLSPVPSKPICLTLPLQNMTKWTAEDFTKLCNVHRATRA